MNRARDGVEGCGVSIPSLDMPPSQWMHQSTQKLSESHCANVLIELSLPRPQVGGWGWKFQPFNHLVFLVTPAPVTSLDELRCEELLLNNKTFPSLRNAHAQLSTGNQGQRPNTFLRHSTPSHWEVVSVR